MVHANSHLLDESKRAPLSAAVSFQCVFIITVVAQAPTYTHITQNPGGDQARAIVNVTARDASVRDNDLPTTRFFTQILTHTHTCAETVLNTTLCLMLQKHRYL